MAGEVHEPIAVGRDEALEGEQAFASWAGPGDDWGPCRLVHRATTEQQDKVRGLDLGFGWSLVWALQKTVTFTCTLKCRLFRSRNVWRTLRGLACRGTCLHQHVRMVHEAEDHAPPLP